MFKSSPTCKPSSALRSSDRRKLIHYLEELYSTFKSASTLNPELILSLVPIGPESDILEKRRQAERAANSDGNGTNGNGKPKGKKEEEIGPKTEIIPTIYSLSLFPDLLPRINTWKSVVQVCLTGSSLMAPGLLPFPETFYSSSPSASNVSSTATASESTASTESADGFADQPPTLEPEHTLIRPGSLVSIVSYPSSTPLLVARAEMSYQEMCEVKLKGAKGKAARMIQVYDDSLWNLGSKKDPPVEAWGDENAGLVSEMGKLKVVSGKERKSLKLEEGGEETEAINSEDEVEAQMNQETSSKSNLNNSSDLISSINQFQDGDFTSIEVDEILKLALISILSSDSFRSLSENPSFFPLSSSTFYSTYLLPSRPMTFPPIQIRPLKTSKSKPSFPVGSKFDEEVHRKVGKEVEIKKSSSKKLGKFLKGLEKDGWLKIKERNGEVLILRFEFDHQDLKSFIPYLTTSQYQESFGSTESTVSETSTSTSKEIGSSSTSSTCSKIIVQEFFSPSKSTASLFEAVENPSDLSSLYTRLGVSKVVQQYIQQRKLSVISNMAFIRPDELLSNLWSPPDNKATKNKSNQVKKVETTPSEIKREELIRKVLEQCSPSHRILKLTSSNAQKLLELEQVSISEPESTDFSLPQTLRNLDSLSITSTESIGSIKKGSYSPILISLKLRAGRKVVTLLTRLEDHGLDSRSLASEIMKSVGASTSVNELPGHTIKQPKLELFIQGDQRKFLIEGKGAFLSGKGIDVRRMVKVEDKK